MRHSLVYIPQTQRRFGSMGFKMYLASDTADTVLDRNNVIGIIARPSIASTT